MFDPLHQWLGIPAADQPPNHYRLLGLAMFESETDVINAAADRQLAFLHSMANGERAADAEDLSNQVSAARLCLVSRPKKKIYDDRLRALIAATVAPDAAADESSPSGDPGFLAPVSPAAMVTPAAPVAAAHTATTHPAEATQAAATQAQTTGQPVSIATQDRTLRRTDRQRRRRSGWNYFHYSSILMIVVMALIGIAVKRNLLTLSLDRFGIDWSENDRAEQVDPANVVGPTGVSPMVSSAPSPAGMGPAEMSPAEMGQQPNDAAPENSVYRPTTPSAGAAGRMNAAAGTNAAGRTNTAGRTNAAGKMNAAAERSEAGPMDTANSVPTDAANSGMMMAAAAAVDDPEAIADDLPPIPMGPELASAMELVSDLYKDQYSAANTAAEKLALAQQMYRDGIETADDAVGRFALWTVARTIHATAGRFGDAIQIDEAIANHYRDVDLNRRRVESLKASADGISGSQMPELVSVSVDVIRRLAAEQDFESAAQFGDYVQQTFGTRMTRNRRKELTAARDEVAALQQRFAAYQVAAGALVATPEDPKANQTVGAYLCLVQQRWQAGLPHLAAGPASPVTAAAQAELAAQQDIQQAIKIADVWYDLAPRMPDSQSTDAVLRHSLHWYDASQSVVVGLERKKVELRLAELEQRFPDRLPGDGEATVFEGMAAANPDGGVNLDPSQPAAGPAMSDQPEIIGRKWRTGSDSRRDYASVDDQTLVVGIGRRPDGIGQAEAGVELRGVKVLTVDGKSSHKEMAADDAYAKSGFVVDYHTAEGYSRRVFLGLGLKPAREFTAMPTWGTATKPTLVTDIGRSDSYRIDLARWAPPQWDGQCWFTLLIQNVGTDRTLTATLSW
ncbi:hypothetical protein K227x_61570 [Rubripirellula lacrimiformis]|uniref:Uncharacterized protein n=1 Tax=Rubripirellula lacrimiformis TaxID=1930273 RepID=A0A517NKX9_9BACT|nr:hypothetical protein [Rubripirellula lacrimiformis]QDT07729.1 hypothetical protein K227x_61570 [Rubripirellula lacrimiformis]